MPTYQENRETIKKRLYKINTTMDRGEAYEATIDYILNIAEKCYRQGVDDTDRWHVDEWSESDTVFRLIEFGVINAPASDKAEE